MQTDVIAAIATGLIPGGVGIVRISGSGAIETADRMVKLKGRHLTEAEPRHMYLGLVKDGEETLDEALIVVMKAPHSYTAEDTVELQCHGGLMTLRKTLELTWKAGARPAERGEFTKRAFLNGRLDLSEAQAVMDIIQARTETSLTMAAGHLTGHFSKEIQSMRHDVLGMIAHIEAAIDFPEDEVDDILTYDIEKNVVEIRNKIANLLKTAHAGRILRDGLLTAIIGKPNVGKSSLLNSLLREERAIVTDVPGTTRDSIEEYADVGGIPLRIIDTAGIRATDDVVERIGVEKARSYVKEASLILALFDASRPLDSEDAEILKLVRGRDAILLLNKDDLAAVVTPAMLQERAGKDVTVITISTRTQDGLADLTNAITAKVYAGTQAGQEGTFVTDARQAEILRQADEHLEASIRTIEASMGLDFISIDLRSAWEKLGELTGETVGEDIINEIFSKFCIGK